MARKSECVTTSCHFGSCRACRQLAQRVGLIELDYAVPFICSPCHLNVTLADVTVGLQQSVSEGQVRPYYGLWILMPYDKILDQVREQKPIVSVACDSQFSDGISKGPCTVSVNTCLCTDVIVLFTRGPWAAVFLACTEAPHEGNPYFKLTYIRYYMGTRQNDGPFLGPQYSTAANI